MDLSDVDDELRGQVEAYVRWQVALGVKPYAAIVDDTVESFDEEDEDVVELLACEVAAAEFAAHADAQAGWPEVTDNDRLTLAFRALDLAGIVARESFSCCQNCGLTEIGEEVAEGETPRGYAFYHQQDAEHAAEGSVLHVAYGLFGQPPSTEIGAEVAAALREQGLPVDWDGETASRIRVPLTWRRRRTGRLAAVPATVDDDVDVEVELLDAWSGRYAPGNGPISASWLVGLHLPWMPAGIRLGISLGGARLTVHRDWDVLVGTCTGTDRAPVRVDRHDGMVLVRLLRAEDGPVVDPGSADPAGSDRKDLVEVSWEHSAGRQYPDVPLTLAESVDVLHRMPVRTGAWMSCRGRSGGIVQMRWEQRRLWLETPDVEACASLGRHVTIPEAERMIRALATEDRVAVPELDGVTTVPWN